MAVRKLLTSNSHVEFQHQMLDCLVSFGIQRIMGLFLVSPKWILHSNSHIPNYVTIRKKNVSYFSMILYLWVCCCCCCTYLLCTKRFATHSTRGFSFLLSLKLSLKEISFIFHLFFSLFVYILDIVVLGQLHVRAKH